MFEGDTADAFLVWAGAWEAREFRARFVPGSRLRVACTTEVTPRYRISASSKPGDARAIRHTVRISDAIEVMAGAARVDGSVVVAPGTNVFVSSEGTSDVSIDGDCGDVRVEGAGGGTVNIRGWPRALTVDRPSSNVDIDLLPGAGAVNAMTVRAKWALIRVPARSAAHAEVPRGWAVACPAGVDPACGSEGPVVMGTGPGAFRVEGEHGLIRVVDWSADGEAAGGEDALTALERRHGATIADGRSPQCFDLLRPGCGWPWESCVER